MVTQKDIAEKIKPDILNAEKNLITLKDKIRRAREAGIQIEELDKRYKKQLEQIQQLRTAYKF